MENIEITREEINKILLSSPMTLPESPSKVGLGSGQIKGLFYKFIPLFAEIINTHLNILLSKGEGGAYSTQRKRPFTYRYKKTDCRPDFKGRRAWKQAKRANFSP